MRPTWNKCRAVQCQKMAFDEKQVKQNGQIGQNRQVGKNGQKIIRGLPGLGREPFPDQEISLCSLFKTKPVVYKISISFKFSNLKMLYGYIAGRFDEQCILESALTLFRNFCYSLEKLHNL